jgi:hypothetical protein
MLEAAKNNILNVEIFYRLEDCYCSQSKQQVKKRSYFVVNRLYSNGVGDNIVHMKMEGMSNSGSLCNQFKG